jgi:divalent metal cation (Fe/Co/Zn/Cd) transporter
MNSPALVADGNHARVDGFVSLGVLASAAVVALGVPIADPLIGLINERYGFERTGEIVFDNEVLLQLKLR